MPLGAPAGVLAGARYKPRLTHLCQQNPEVLTDQQNSFYFACTFSVVGVWWGGMMLAQGPASPVHLI